MPVQWQNVSVQFVGGKDTKTDEKLVIPSKLIELQNAQVTEIGEIKKRNGFTSLTKKIKLAYSGIGVVDETRKATHIAELNDGLIAFCDGKVLTFSDSLGAWYESGKFSPCIVSRREIGTDIAASENTIPSGDVAYHDGLLCAAYRTSDTGGLSVEIVNAETGLHVSKFVDFASSSQVALYPRVIGCGRGFLVFYKAAGTGNLFCVLITTPDFDAVTYAVTVYTATSLYNFDVALDKGGETVWVAVNDNGNIKGLHLAVSSLTASSAYTIDTGAASTSYVAVAALTGGDCMTAYRDSSNNVQLDRLAFTNPPTLDSSSGSIISAANVRNIGLVESDHDGTTSTVHVYVSITPASNRDHCTVSGGIYTTASGSITESSAMTSFTRRRAELVAKPLAHSGSVYIVTNNAVDYDDGGALFLTRNDSSSYGGYGEESECSFIAPGSAYGFNLYSSTPYLSSMCQYRNGEYVCVVPTLNKLLTTDSGTVRSNVLSAISVRPDGHISSAIFCDSLLSTGGYLSHFDGRICRELNFFQPPAPFSASNLTAGTSGSLTPNSTYNYVVLYEYVDVAGRVHYSQISDSASITLAGGGTEDSVDVDVPILKRSQDRADAGAPDGIIEELTVRAVVYRTTVGSSVYQRTDLVPAAAVADFTSTVTDTISDTSLASNQIIYTDSGELENSAVPSCTSIAIVNQRAFVSATDGSVWYSKKEVAGLGPQFSQSQKITVPGGSAGFYVGGIDDKVIILKKGSLEYFYGEGPNALGQGSFSSIFPLSSDVGCVSAGSILSTHMGLFFQSNKGIRLLTRGLQVHPQIGLEMDNIVKGKTIKAATLIQDKDECRFLLDDRVLVYNYVLNQWGEIPLDGTCGASATNWRGRYALLCANGTVKVENDGHKDDGLPYSLKVGTAWIKTAGLQGFQRVRRFSILGSKSSNHKLVVKVYYDYEEKPADVFFFTPDDGVPAGSDVLQYTRRLTRQKCSAIRFEFSDEDLSENGEGYAISDLTLEVAIKGGINRLGKGRSFSVTNGWKKTTSTTPAHGGHQHRHQYGPGGGGGQGGS